MSNYDLNSRVIDLTLGELLDAVEEKVKAILPGSLQKQPQDKNFVYGLKGLAKLLGCSKTTAARVKASGKYDAAITQIGALLIIDADEVLRIARESKQRIL